MALAAVLLVCGIGAASAQGQMPGQTQGQVQDQMQPLYRQQVPDTVPLGSNINDPKVNPSAAGTLMGRDARGRTDTPDATAGQSGSREISPLTHPIEAWRARREMQEQGTSVPLGTTPVPYPTMQHQDGR
jgi:hypothetical protein